jgi:hypothetical protein
VALRLQDEPDAPVPLRRPPGDDIKGPPRPHPATGRRGLLLRGLRERMDTHQPLGEPRAAGMAIHHPEFPSRAPRRAGAFEDEPRVRPHHMGQDVRYLHGPSDPGQGLPPGLRPRPQGAFQDDSGVLRRRMSPPPGLRCHRVRNLRRKDLRREKVFRLKLILHNRDLRESN